jgi:cell division protease FtsH
MARNVSPATSEAIDKEIKTIVENAHAKALAILNANRDLLESISEKLLETEVIEGDFLTGLLSQVKPAEVNV